MRYTAKKLNAGGWAVFNGKKYFVTTVTDDEEAARDRALIMSAQFYQDKIWEIQERLEKRGYFKREDCDMGDLLC